LKEVARILVQKRWQNRSADHNVGNPVGSDRTSTLAVTLKTLTVVWNISCLIDSCKQSYPDDGNRIGCGPDGEVELQLRCEWGGVVIIDHVEIRDDAEDALFLLYLDLLGGNFFGGINHRHSGDRLCNLELG